MKTQKSHRRSKDKSSFSCFGLFLVSISILMVGIVFFTLSHVSFGTNSSNLTKLESFASNIGKNIEFVSSLEKLSHDSLNYEALVKRAHELQERYENLTSQWKFDKISDISTAILDSPQDPSKNAVEINEGVLKKVTSSESTTSLPNSYPLSTSSLSSSTGDFRDLVIGMAHNTDPKNLAVFCASFREVNQDAKIVLFINKPVAPRSREIAEKYHVELKEYDLAAVPKRYQEFHPSTLRWIFIYEYLRDEQILATAPQSSILLIDVRDSAFQKDPFTTIMSVSMDNRPIDRSALFASPSHLYAFHGVESMKIGECGWNGGWVKDCFGDQVLALIKERPILCSGVSIGDTPAMMLYVTLMYQFITGRPPSTFSDLLSSSLPSPAVASTLRFAPLQAKWSSLQSRFPQCERNGVDQGVHNVLWHLHLLDGFLDRASSKEVVVSHIQSQGMAKVANMQAHVARWKAGEHRVVNSLDEEVSIVHQYDRYPEIQSFYFKKYVYWVDATDFGALWNEESACHAFDYRKDYDLFKGVCDIKMQGGATSAASCCQGCSNLSHCQGFTFYSGVCYFKSCGQGRTPGMPLRGAISGYLH